MKISKIGHSRRGFTLIELLVGMTIFTVGITSIFLLLQSTLKTANISRNEIVVANLIREQLELVKFLRDSNVKNFSEWDNGVTEGNFLVYNNFEKKDGIKYDDASGGVDFNESSVKLEPIVAINFEDSATTLEQKFQTAQLCYDDKKFFVPCASNISLTEKSPFAVYTRISAMKFSDTDNSEKSIEKDGKIQGYTIDARVLVRDGGNLREYDGKTHLTDWK